MVKFTGNSVVYVVVVGHTQDADGFGSATEVDRWRKFAEVYDRRGSNSQPYQQNIWQYDIIVKMRKGKTKPTQSNYLIEYNGQTLKIEGIRQDREDFEHFEICYCTYIDNQITIEES